MAEQRELPSNIEAEQALLGEILMDERAYSSVSPFLEERHFSELIHRKIYGIAGELIRAGKPAGPIHITKFLPRAKIGDMTIPQYLAKLAAERLGVGNARNYGMAIHEAWIQREVISATLTFLDFAYDPAPGVDVLGERTDLEARLEELRGQRVQSLNRRGGGARYLDKIKATQLRGSVVGIPIALPHIQRVLSERSFEIGNLYGLLSSSGEGKTSLMVQLVYDAIVAGCAVQIQSYDQTEEQIIRQMIAQHHKIEARRQELGPDHLSAHEWLDIGNFTTWIDAQRWQVQPCRHEGADELVSYAGRFVRDKGFDRPTLIVTDHIMRVTPEKGTERSHDGAKAAGINAKIKAGAGAKGVAWLMLNQRNTEGMKRANPRPIAADLHGGEGAKQSYDAVLYLYRFLKFYRERKAIAATHADRKMLEVFPSDVRNGEQDIAEIGAIKVRFGDVSVRETLNFNARYTLLEPHEPVITAEELSFLK